MARDTCTEGMIGKEVFPQTGNAACPGRACASHHTNGVCGRVQARGGREQSPSRGVVAGNHTASRGRGQPYVYVSSIGVTGGIGAFAIWGRKMTARCVPLVSDFEYFELEN